MTGGLSERVSEWGQRHTGGVQCAIVVEALEIVENLAGLVFSLWKEKEEEAQEEGTKDKISLKLIKIKVNC